MVYALISLFRPLPPIRLSPIVQLQLPWCCFYGGREPASKSAQFCHQSIYAPKFIPVDFNSPRTDGMINTLVIYSVNTGAATRYVVDPRKVAPEV